MLTVENKQKYTIKHYQVCFCCSLIARVRFSSLEEFFCHLWYGNKQNVMRCKQNLRLSLDRFGRRHQHHQFNQNNGKPNHSLNLLNPKIQCQYKFEALQFVIMSVTIRFNGVSFTHSRFYLHGGFN